MTYIKTYLPGSFMILGLTTAIFNLMSFSTDRGCGIGLLPSLGPECSNSVEYFYTDEVKILVSLGVALFMLGVLMYKNKK